MGQKVRVVCGTNVAVSALLFTNGQLDWLRNAWRIGSAIPLVCHETTSELLRVLAYPKFRLTREEQEELLGDYLPFAEIVELEDPPEIPDCRDPNDRIFLELALYAQADALVTGDDDLLALKTHCAIPILTPTELRVSYTDLTSP